jgi:RES domain/HEPN/RES N-terminal domain 1
MGFAKEAEMAAWARGFDFLEGAVCGRCVRDPAIVGFVAENATQTRCDFCGRFAGEPIACEADLVLELVSRSIKAEYNLAENELLFDEGDYQGSYHDTADLLDWELDQPLGGGEFAAAVRRVAREQYWCRRDYYFGDRDKHLLRSWQEFAETVKYESRYLFVWGTLDQDPDEESLSGEPRLRGGALLRETGRLIGRLDLVRTMGRGAELVRVRHFAGEACCTAKKLGSPPREKAASNRMSPAGIPMFYAAFDEATAVAETQRGDVGGQTVVATFATSRDCRILDLADLPNVPSLFDDARREDRWSLGFLHAFRDRIIVPVVPDDRVHIDYVPTQIVSEYLRLWFAPDGGDIDGVIFPSSRRAGGRCAAMFVDGENCREQDEECGDADGLCLVLEGYRSL